VIAAAVAELLCFETAMNNTAGFGAASAVATGYMSYRILIAFNGTVAAVIGIVRAVIEIVTAVIRIVTAIIDTVTAIADAETVHFWWAKFGF
jgi:hypothetical protein